MKHMKKQLFVTVFFTVLGGIAFSQSKVVLEAEQMFLTQKFCEAAEKLTLAYSKVKSRGVAGMQNKATMAFKTAESYRLTERYQEATEWYERAILLEYFTIDPIIYFYNAEMYRSMNEIDKAIKNYQEYKKYVPSDKRADIGMESATRRELFVSTVSTKIKVDNEQKVNSTSADMSPMFGDKKSMMMYFGSSRNGSTGKDKDPRTCENYMDIWIAELDKNGNWKGIQLIDGEDINTEDNEGTIAFDARGKTMFFTRCPNIKKQNMGCEIWVSESKGQNKWNAPTKLELKPHDSLTVGHPCVSPDGTFLIFTSDLPGGYGGRDLWSTTYNKRTKTWSAPVNLGPEINTSGDDMFATFAENGDLYYSTNGKPGVGGLDIFRAEKQGDQYKWTNPINLGTPINSYGNDYGLIEHTARTGFFTSERKGPNGEQPDIYKYVIPPYVYDLKIIVSDLNDKNLKIEDAQIQVASSTGETWTGVTDKQGSVFWDVKPNGDRYIDENTSYTISVSKDGYHDNAGNSSITTVGLKYDQNFVIDLALLPKKPIHLPEVRYPLAQWELLVDSTFDSKDSLNFVYDLLSEYPMMVLELSSHTDSRGSANSNQVLSENRARKCYEYLVTERGIDPRRIVPVGKGEDDPRIVYTNGEEYATAMPRNEDGTPLEGWDEVKLTEQLIDSYKKDNKELFELLHQWNRRTEGRVLSMEFDPQKAPEAPTEYLEYKKVPRR